MTLWRAVSNGAVKPALTFALVDNSERTYCPERRGHAYPRESHAAGLLRGSLRPEEFASDMGRLAFATWPALLRKPRAQKPMR